LSDNGISQLFNMSPFNPYLLFGEADLFLEGLKLLLQRGLLAIASL
jgi:hypothetical protein